MACYPGINFKVSMAILAANTRTLPVVSVTAMFEPTKFRSDPCIDGDYDIMK